MVPLPPGPFFTTRELRHYFELVIGGCRTKLSDSATKFRILEDPKMCSDFIIRKPSHVSYSHIMKLKREGVTIMEYYEYVEH